MKIVHDWPPFYDEIAHAVGVPPLTAVFTHGDLVFTLAAIDVLPPDLEVHEHKHTEQQAEMGVREWWQAWLTDKGFRLRQELAAYQAQYRAYPKGLKEYASALATIYGLNLSEAKARRMISQ